MADWGKVPPVNASIKKVFNMVLLDRSQYPETYLGELHFQSSRVILPATFICIFAWLGYIPVDGQLWPGEPLIKILRIGMTLVSSVLFILQFFTFFKKRSMWLLAALGFYLEGSTGMLTGLYQGDPVMWRDTYSFWCSVVAP
jgi:hypothetical protein